MTGTPKARRAQKGRVAALACAGALMLSGCDFSVYSLPLPGGADLGDDPYAVTVQFRDVLDLVPQSSVKVNDVTVGKVDDISLDGYTAKVRVLLREDVELPDNALAEIRQTSLLGEKFVSLKEPDTGSNGNRLGDGDVIPLERSGRNPEVEEVLGAMSLLLNGGGVAQLKTISTELNKALEGREGDVKSVLQQLDVFMGQLDENKADIVQAIESLNKLAVSVNKQRDSIELALDEMPAALASIDRQRDDLVKMLRALTELSSVGTEVIRASKTATITSLQQLDPVLTKLAEAGDSLPKAFQVFLTYPFVDEVVGRNPAQARNLHMGDYTNLSVQMDIDLAGLPAPVEGTVEEVELTCRQALRRVRDAIPANAPGHRRLQGLLEQAEEICGAARVDEFLANLTDRATALVCDEVGGQVPGPLGDALRDQCADGGGGGGSGDGDGDEGGLPDVEVPDADLGLNRSAPGPTSFEEKYSLTVPEGAEYDSTLGSLLLQGVASR